MGVRVPPEPFWAKSSPPGAALAEVPLLSSLSLPHAASASDKVAAIPAIRTRRGTSTWRAYPRQRRQRRFLLCAPLRLLDALLALRALRELLLAVLDRALQVEGGGLDTGWGHDWRHAFKGADVA